MIPHVTHLGAMVQQQPKYPVMTHVARCVESCEAAIPQGVQELRGIH